MKLGVALPYAEGAMSPEDIREFVTVADSLGFHSVWVAEAWTFDAFLMLSSLIEHTSQINLATGIVNVYSRTPSMIGQSIATLDALSGGRAILGIGASGPQVIAGWHGLPYDRPVQRTRETVDIVRMILRRDRLKYSGQVFDLRSGLKLINHPIRPAVPITIAALGPRNVEMAAEVADAWMPVLYAPERAADTFGESLAAGAAKRSADLAPLEIWPAVSVAVTEAAEPATTIAKHGLALYVGGMGSRKKNFYNDLVCRYGYAAEAAKIQELYLGGQQQEAAAHVPDQMVSEFTVIGAAGHVQDRFAAMRESGATGAIINLIAMDQGQRLKMLQQIAELGL